jgi:hypothetical protein
MSNLSRAILATIAFLIWLTGFAWVVSVSGGYHFGFTLLVVVGAYVALLLTYACYRTAVQKARVARLKKSGVTEDGLPSDKG